MNKIDSILKKSGEIQNFHNLDINQEWNAFIDIVESHYPEDRISKFNLDTKKTPLIYKLMRVAAAVLLIGFLAVDTLAPKGDNRSQYIAQKDNDVIELNDGSIITLAQGTTLDYPLNYDNQSKRYVYLNGKEATFSVTRSILPFVVHYDSIQVEVIGTKFVLSSEHNAIQIKNIEGTIRVSSLSNPDQFVIMHTQDEYSFDGKFIDKNAIEVGEVADNIDSYDPNKLAKEEKHASKNQQKITNTQRSVNDFNDPFYSTYKLGSILKEFLGKQHKKSIKIERKFKYDPEIKVKLNLQQPIETILNDLKAQGFIDFEKGSCEDCLIISAPK
ncbi:MAG: FecR family protein [Chitinophagales bacterium]|nr:FecR family protein [Chitinophagales bacterium]